MTSTSADPQRMAWRTVVLLGAILVLVGSGASPAAQTASRPSLLYCGWFGNTTPTPAFIANNKAFLETQPFNGLVAYLRNDATGFNATTRTMTTTSLSATSLAALLAPLRNTTFNVLRENFALIQGTTPPDFFDDWSIPIANLAAVARALKDAGLKGIVFDNEQYWSPWGNYPTGCKYAARSLAEYQAQARLRGRQAMEAMIAQFPEIAVITLHGPYVSEPRVPTPLFPVWYTMNELFGPFFTGMMEGQSGTALHIDGGELYHLRSADEFYRSYTWRKFTLPSDAFNCAFIPPALRPAWPGKSSICFGVYDRPFGGADMNPAIFRTTIANALKQADRYVWFYTEGATFLKPASAGGASATWVDAVRQALNDAAASAAPAVPAGPSHFVATSTSSSAIDLAWTDLSNNETGFEIERKTGSAGTWTKVLTTGANVSTIDDTGLASSTSYVYRARAVNSTGASTYSNESTAATAAAPAPVPAAPSHLVATATSSSAIDLTWWDMSGNETSFELERKTGSAGTWSKVLSTGANISTIDDIGLASSTTYYYRMRAVNSSGPSTYSAEASATTKAPAGPVPATPTHMSIRTRVVGRIGVTWWDMSNNETGFQVERKTGAAGVWALLATKGANVSIHDDYSVASGRTYYYRVRSVNGNGASAWSNEISTTAP